MIFLLVEGTRVLRETSEEGESRAGVPAQQRAWPEVTVLTATGGPPSPGAMPWMSLLNKNASQGYTWALEFPDFRLA